MKVDSLGRALRAMQRVRREPRGNELLVFQLRQAHRHLKLRCRHRRRKGTARPGQPASCRSSCYTGLPSAGLSGAGRGGRGLRAVDPARRPGPGGEWKWVG